jgi:S-adenosylmethionine:tRNA ribosyltransferase-isomerase
MQEKACVYWNVLVGGANKWKNEDPIFLKTAELSITAKKIARFDTHFLIQFSWDQMDWSFAEVLQHAGNIPLPPYMQRTAAIDDATRYQTVYAKAEGSVAAPTAGLHFTERLFNQLHQKNIHTSFLQLHVGAGTFMPVKSATLSEHPMHAEWIVLDKAQIKNIQEGLAKGLIAVGTTSLRSLESMYWIGYKLHFNIPVDWEGVAVEQWFAYEQEKDLDSSTALQAILTYLEEHQLDFVHTKTQILIARPYKAKMIKALITNFHQPQSTLLVLVDALIGEVWKELYDTALKNKYRFLSYGDGCLFWL